MGEALELMDEHDRRYLVVTCSENKALGFVRRRDLHRQTGACSQYLSKFNATAAYDEHLRILLSRMYEFNRSWLPVMDAERVFLGEVTQESIAEYLSSGRSRGARPALSRRRRLRRPDRPRLPLWRGSLLLATKAKAILSKVEYQSREHQSVTQVGYIRSCRAPHDE